MLSTPGSRCLGPGISSLAGELAESAQGLVMSEPWEALQAAWKGDSCSVGALFWHKGLCVWPLCHFFPSNITPERTIELVNLTEAFKVKEESRMLLVVSSMLLMH